MYTLSLKELNKDALSLAGGKGANLGELVNAGLPVPAGFVVTTEGYRRFVEANDLQSSIDDLFAQITVGSAQEIETVSGQIRERFLDGEIPAELADAIRDAYVELDGGSGAVAVRSSATAEDLPGASFAGQQDTFLNVREERTLLDAVTKCWASLWTARAMSYRRQQGIDEEQISMAVVVQSMVNADVSGILFTANPASGERDEMVVNASYGLGEAIVSGAVTPDSFVLERASGQVMEQSLGSKESTIVPADSGVDSGGESEGDSGVVTQRTPDDQRAAASLTQEQLWALAGLGRRVADLFGAPQDVEWAFAGETLWLLQARPITNLPPAPLKDVTWEPVRPGTLWARRQIVEHMPEPLSPLFEDLYLQQGLDASMNHLMDMMTGVGGLSFDMDRMLPDGFGVTINGYAYSAGSFKMKPKDGLKILAVYGRLPKLFKEPTFSWDDHVLPTYLSLAESWDSKDLTTVEDEALLAGMQELATADSTYWFGSAGNLGLSRILDPVFNWLLRSPLFRGALPKPGLGSTAFLRGFDSKALEAQADMEALADAIRASAALKDAVLRAPTDDLLDVLAAHPEGAPVLAQVNAYLKRYGHQIYNLDFVVPTQNEDPRPILLSLKALVKSPPKKDVRTRQAEMAAERDALVAKTERRLNPVSRWIFRRVWRWTKKFAPYREDVMFYMGAAWPTLRRLGAELGQRLAEAGVIATADDIYFLNSEEIERAIEARQTESEVPDFVQLAQDRRELREARKRLSPPAKVPEHMKMGVGPIDLSMFDPTPTQPENRGPVLNGHAVSMGQVTGRASVIRSIEEFDRMEPGTILVCRTTTPAWTPLFSQAVGLVTDVGGALAHGSIVARENGIPAVMGTGSATERIQSGMRIQVDGDQGTVTLLDEVESELTADMTADTDEAVSSGAENGGISKKWLLGLLGVVGIVLWWRRRQGKSLTDQM